MTATETEVRHPAEAYLRRDRIPHIWCAGCGLGSAMSCFIEAVQESPLDLSKLCVVSGIGCTGRVPGYLNFDSFHVTHGRPVPFAMGLRLANPELKVVVFSGDGDLVAIGGNHLIHAARRNVDMTVICVNNFIYGMTGGQSGPTTHLTARTTTTPYGNTEHPFNLPLLVGGAGAVYVARWTTMDMRRLRNSMAEALCKRGFTFIEVISPCPTNYGRRNKLGDGLEEMRYYHEHSVIRHFPPLEEVELTLGGEIVVGKFVERERPTFEEALGLVNGRQGGDGR